MIKNLLYKLWNPALVNSLWFIIQFVVFLFIPIGIFAYLDYPLLNWLMDHHWATGAMLWIVFAITDASMHKYLIEDGIKQNFHPTIDPHIFANIYRFFVWLGLWAFTGLATATFLGIAFPFFQCGRLYSLRGKSGVEQYKNGWWSNPSATSSAKSSKYLKWWVRTLFALIAFCGTFYFNRYNLW